MNNDYLYFPEYYRYNDRPIIRIAMIDGKEMQYDVCTSTRSSIGPEINWHYLGTGYIYSINGIVQGYGPDDVMHFWVHK